MGVKMDGRKLKILAAVVDEYIVTGEPVGSKAVMKYITASSATIRNEMAELEKQGYLEQPHTSAGRIPTYSGYRIYVDDLMERSPLTAEEQTLVESMLPQASFNEQEIVQSASLALAELTKCAAVVAHSTPKFSVISKVEVIPTGKRMYVILLVTSSGSVKNRVCRLSFDLTTEQLAFFSNFVKQNLEGIALEKLSDDLCTRLEEALGTYMMTLSPLVDEIYRMSREMTGEDISLKGELNLLKTGEFDQNEIIRFLDNKSLLNQFLDSSFGGIHVMFSEETDSFIINNSSLITSTYSRGGMPAGTLGLIGPMRLDYAKFIPYLEYFTQKITELLSEPEQDDTDHQS
ncbi:MAG: heat-inducible transcriptional repressor HrcA [Oscillospiraceae bacterium]